MNIKQALIEANKKLKSIKTASLDAEVLLSYVFKKPKEFLYTYPEKNLTKLQETKFNNIIKRRVKGEPVAYLINHKEFYGLDFYVDKRVLVPRPETELLVEEVVTGCKSQIANRKLVIADTGTGSGAIIITLAKILPTTYHLPPTTYCATDISKDALLVARKNAKIHKVSIKFFQGNLLEPIKNQRIDVIAANLPYGHKNLLKPSKHPNKIGLRFEPRIAITAEKSGLAVYEELFKQINKLKYKPQIVICEIDNNQAGKMTKMIKENFGKVKLEIKKDLAGLHRIIIVEL